MNKADAAAYAIRLLRMNPMSEARRIIETRASFLGLTAERRATARDFAGLQQRRAAAERALEEVRGEFWTLPLADLKARLAGLPVGELPDLEAAVARLRHVAELRPEFPRLAQERACNETLFNNFKTVVVLPPSEGGLIKERAVRHLVKHNKLRAAKKMLRLMRTGYPRLLELEPDWFELVERTAAGPRFSIKMPTGFNIDVTGPVRVIGLILTAPLRLLRAVLRPVSIDMGIPGWAIWIGLVILLKIVLKLMKD